MTVPTTSVRSVPQRARTLPAEQGDALSRMVWIARRYAAWLVPLLVNCVTVAVLATGEYRGEHSYRAEALVVASELRVPPAQMPRFGASIFSRPTVSAKVAARVQRIPDLGSLIPEHVSMDPVPGSVVFRVAARADDGRSAALLANTAADVFAEELNRAGTGVGRFAVQTRATEPPETAPPPLSFPKALVLALVSGLILAAGAVAALLRVRRPLLRPSEVSDALGAAVLAVLPLSRRLLYGRADPAGVQQLATSREVAVLARRLARLDGEAVVLQCDEQLLPATRAVADALGRQGGPRVLVAHDVAAVHPGWPWVVAVAEGTPRRTLDAVVASVEGRLGGAVFLRPGRRPARSGAPAQEVITS